VTAPANLNRRVAENIEISQDLWIGKAQFTTVNVRNGPFEAKPLFLGTFRRRAGLDPQVAQ
jgi:hypothetical protein